MSLANPLSSIQRWFIWSVYLTEFLLITRLATVIEILDAVVLIFVAPLLSAVPHHPRALNECDQVIEILGARVASDDD